MIAMISFIILLSLFLGAFDLFHNRNFNFLILLCVSILGLLCFEGMWNWIGVFIASVIIEATISSSLREDKKDI